ncbi:hypothetical protein BD626DRAFT_490741 [Schizophyllum amplum]|uniref:Transthyretin/hydroxyisourate hydrolase domain-containing protein n=1 Tax=Schizophyllum amplum TaxID=97359 RepID=A0A550CJS7_9AGAR|nr:hypothetical protein BD626DRAFT_490741 [Auriculariopsis ampla]
MLLVAHPQPITPTIGLGSPTAPPVHTPASQSAPSPVTCQVSDAFIGKPAAGVEIQLQELRREGDGKTFRFDPLAVGTTNASGCCIDLLPPRGSEEAKRHDAELKPGAYKMIFRTREYFDKLRQKSLYPWVEISFTIADAAQDYNLVLHVSPYSFTTHRGA